MRIMLLGLLVLLPVLAKAQVDLTVPLPPGVTQLGDIGMYRVGYQSYDAEPVWMPDSWVGHFEPVAGISYLPGERVLGREAILLHSPWHIPPGKTWVDYRLKLPKVAPITLSLGIAMRPDMVTPDRSDGVTFGVYLIGETREQELMREHWAKGEWKDRTFDISTCAGETVTLRLQVEPGPANSPSWDYSYFGEPALACGAAGQARAELLKQLTATKAYKATADRDLAPLANRSGQGVTPNNLLPCRNAVTRKGSGTELGYEGGDCRVVFRYEPKTGTLEDFTCQVDGGVAFRPMAGGGVFGEVTEGERTRRVRLEGGKLVTAEVKGATLDCDWEYELAGQRVPLTWTFGIVGKALTVRAECAEPVLVGLSLGNIAGAPLRRTVAVPYMPGNGIFYLPAQNLYVNRYLDWTVSHASYCPQGEASYDRKTDGALNPLLESGYVAVSPVVGEVLPNAPWPASPYLRLLGDKVMLDIWGHHKGTFAGSGENLRDLKDNGVDHVAIINHVWQRFGYDVQLPDHVPANPGLGGDEGMIAFGKAANDCGYVWSVHENYIDLYPDAPSYDETACVLRQDGSKSPAWYNEGTKVQSFGLKCNRAKGYAEQNAPYIHRTYGTNAAYLDVHTCVPPWHQLDHQADQPMAAMALAKVKYDGELFQYMRDTHQGPLFGEGANQFYWAGQCDGVEAQVGGGEEHTPLLDFDLLKLHPQMVNHGMGYYERWFTEGYQSRWGRDVGTPEDVDKYRAQELAYGHAGFIGSISTNNAQWVAKEHHMCHPIQRLHATEKAKNISYIVEGKAVTASVALALGETSRQRIEYPSGLVLWVNWNKEAWKVGETVLPQWGFLATGPGTRLSTSLVEGKLADYAECPEFVFADARTSFDMPYLRAAVDIEPKLTSFEYLGGNRIRLGYEWAVNDTLDTDLNCFVHFTGREVDRPDRIVFQQDHGLPKPTTQWQRGEVIADGPHGIEVPEDRTESSYDIAIGLFKGARVSLKGLEDGGQRIVIGRLLVTRADGKVTDVKLADLAEVAKDYPQEPTADFRGRLNPPGTTVEFGSVATDGAVKVNREAGRLVVFPYPRDTEFTVALDVKALAAGATAERAKVRGLAAGTQEDLGEVASEVQGGRLVFRVGQQGAGRYVVSW